MRALKANENPAQSVTVISFQTLAKQKLEKTKLVTLYIHSAD